MYLMDTHAFLWFLNDDAKLPSTVRDIIRKAEHLSISVASFWEMVIKASLGKLSLPAPITDLMELCDELHITVLPITSTYLECLQRLPNYHADPFDRMIISQAMADDLIILSADSKFIGYAVDVMWG